MADKPKGLHAKLAEVMAEAERIPKNGVYSSQQSSFKFVQAGDAADAIRKALGSRGVSMLPSAVEVLDTTEHSTRSGGTMTTLTVRTTWTLVDGESGETAMIQSLGTGADAGDKYSPKAQTNAMKYALLMGFLLSTGDDPELSDSSDRRPRQAAPAPAGATETAQTTHDGSLLGIAEVGKVGSQADFLLRQSPEGPVAAFRLKQGRSGMKVIAHGALAVALSAMKPEGQQVKVWGSMQDESFTPAGGRPITYQVVNLERMEGPDFVIPAGEAETFPLFDEKEAAEIAERELAEAAR